MKLLVHNVAVKRLVVQVQSFAVQSFAVQSVAVQRLSWYREIESAFDHLHQG
jgi:hypothetical protein